MAEHIQTQEIQGPLSRKNLNSRNGLKFTNSLVKYRSLPLLKISTRLKTLSENWPMDIKHVTLDIRRLTQPKTHQDLYCYTCVHSYTCTRPTFIISLSNSPPLTGTTTLKPVLRNHCHETTCLEEPLIFGRRFYISMQLNLSRKTTCLERPYFYG